MALPAANAPKKRRKPLAPGKVRQPDPVLSDEEQRRQKTLEGARFIINRLDSQAREQVRAKAIIEDRWLHDLANYYGRYDERTESALIEEGRSRAFVKLTRHKTNAWAARLSDLLFPTDNRNWGISPTPIPALVEAAQKAVKDAEAAIQQANATTDVAQQEAILANAKTFASVAKQARAEVEEAEKRSKRMETAIEDQFIESDYVGQCRDVIEDGCRLGTGILKGPMTSARLRSSWAKSNLGFWERQDIKDPLPEYRRVDPWHFFPDMSATRISECEFTYERSLPSGRDLKRMARKLGFDKEATRRLLEAGPNYLGTDADHLSYLRTLTGEGEQIKDRFVMWEFHGSLECEEIAALLHATGQTEKAERFLEEKDWLDEYRVIIHFCRDEILKIAPEYPLDSGESLYSVWNFEKGETSVFGVGVPHIMGDSQRAINGAWRMMMDNSGLSVGPQIVVNKTAITPQDGSFKLKPLKVWLMSSTAGANPQQRPFEVFDIPNNQQQLAGIIELGKAFIDEETSMPLIAQGEQGAASQTMGGMSMLFNSANVVFRRVVKSWDDDLTKPTLRRAYDWNMQFNPDESIKGDMQPDARGTSVLLVREIQSQTLMQIMTNWTVHPTLGKYIKVRPGLEKTLQTLMITPDDVLMSEDEVQQAEAAAAAAAQEQPEIDPNAMRLEVAQLEANTRLQIAQMQIDAKIMEISQKTGLSEQEIRAKYGIEEMKVQSAERLRAVDIAIEDQREARAVAKGRSPEEAVGVGVG